MRTVRTRRPTLDSEKTDTCDEQVDPQYEANDQTSGGKAEAQCVAASKCDEMATAEGVGDDDDDDDDDDATP